MTEWDKQHSGQVYNDFAQELFERRVRAKKLFRAYNKTEDDEIELRQKLMKELFAQVGNDVWIEPDFRCEFGSNISIGDRVYINFGCIILDCAPISIGDDVLFGPNIGIYAVKHSIDPEQRKAGISISRKVSIGNGVWLGGDVDIMDGVTIGDNAVVGAGSVVTKDIPAGVVAAGNPCRVIREITEADRLTYCR